MAMPELPEVETVRRGLAPAMEARRILSVDLRRADLRFPLPAQFRDRVAGRRVIALRRRAKFLCADLDSGETLIVHLGMSGRLSIEAAQQGDFHHASAASPVHDHVVFHMEGARRITYNDSRRFGFMELWPTPGMANYPRLKALGPEPLTQAFGTAYLDRVLAGRQTSIKAALLDQKIVAGLGNIYVCEALFRAGISPRRLAAHIPGQRAKRLASATNDVIAEAIAAGGSSLRDFAGTDGALGYFQHAFRVYDREDAPCPACGAPVRRIVQSARSTFYCGHCQR